MANTSDSHDHEKKETHGSTSQSHHFDTTMEHIENGVEKQETKGVSTTISSWIKTLSSHKELKGIADDLESLKEAVGEKDGAKVVKLLETLGHETTKAASHAEGTEAEKIKKLGSLLTSSAKKAKSLIK